MCNAWRLLVLARMRSLSIGLLHWHSAQCYGKHNWSMMGVMTELFVTVQLASQDIQFCAIRFWRSVKFCDNSMCRVLVIASFLKMWKTLQQLVILWCFKWLVEEALCFVLCVLLGERSFVLYLFYCWLYLTVSLCSGIWNNNPFTSWNRNKASHHQVQK